MISRHKSKPNAISKFIPAQLKLYRQAVISPEKFKKDICFLCDP